MENILSLAERNIYLDFVRKRARKNKCSFCLYKDKTNIQYVHDQFTPYIHSSCLNCGRGDNFYIHYLRFITGNYQGNDLEMYFKSKGRQVL